MAYLTDKPNILEILSVYFAMKKVAIKRQYVLTYKDIFEESEPQELKALLKNLPLIGVIETISNLLFRLSRLHKDDETFHASNLVSWMMNLPGPAQQQVLAFVQRTDIFNQPDFLLTDKHACLLLLQYAIINCNASDQELTKADQALLLKALLLCNQKATKSQKDVFEWDGKGDASSFADKILPVKMSMLEIERRKDYKIEFMKVFYFFQFCETDKDYKNYLEVFLKHRGLDSYGQYMLNVLHPYLQVSSSDTPSTIIAIDPKIEDYCDFFEQLTINPHGVEYHEDFLQLRQYPLYKSGVNRYVFLYNNFFIDKFYQGFLFDFVKVLQNCGYSTMSYGKLKSDMGNRFSEKVLFYTVIENCFNNYGNKRLSGEELKPLLNDGEPDYYIREGRKIFLFEFKDYTVSSNIKHSGDIDKIKTELSDKLEISRKGTSGAQKKALLQLINSISRIQSGEYGITDDAPTEQCIVYPILVYTDLCLEADGVNYFLRHRFNQFFDEFKIKRHLVKNLVLVHIDTFIAFQDLFNTGKLNLSNCINTYHDYISQKNVLNQVFSFDQYLKYYLVSKKNKLIQKPTAFDKMIEYFSGSLVRT